MAHDINPGRVFFRLEGARRLRNHSAVLSEKVVDQFDDLLVTGKVMEAFTAYDEAIRRQVALKRVPGWPQPTAPTVQVRAGEAWHTSCSGRTTMGVRFDPSKNIFVFSAFATDEVDGESARWLAPLGENICVDPRLEDDDAGLFVEIRRLIGEDKIDADW